jgi:type I restriction enzyme S subunit
MSSDRVPLGSRVALLAKQITPGLFPDETFDYYSIPALDEHGGPVVTLGSTIESGKFLLSRPAVLVSKLNPRKMRVQLFEGQSDHRSVSSTEFMVFEPLGVVETPSVRVG